MTVHAIMVPGGLYMCMVWRLRLLVADPLLGLLPWREKAGVLFACNRPGEHGLHVRLAGSTSATIERVKRRIIGTAIGVPLGLACLLLVAAAPLVVWAAAALAMVIYAMALSERYGIACGAYAFTLIVTLAVSGEHSVPLLSSRAWETLVGWCFWPCGGAGLTAAYFKRPESLTFVRSAAREWRWLSRSGEAARGLSSLRSQPRGIPSCIRPRSAPADTLA